MTNTFEIKDDFYLNKKPFKIIAGGMHYFRTMKDSWKDRLIKLKAMGCNTVETYVPWNMHEAKKGVYAFNGNLDIKAFIELAQSLELFVIVRPSPYICAEWEFGGLPAWLLKDPGMKVRTVYKPFMKHVKEYFEVLFKILAPLQIDQDGPIILMQIENEYGYYGNDKEYLSTLLKIMRDFGTTVPVVTSDGPWGEALDAGSLLADVSLPTMNFGTGAKEHIENFKEKYVNKPVMCMEFWVGWFDAWGDDRHHTRDASDAANELRDILNEGSVNIYMFHGGTNFGFMNGANDLEELKPDVTSYDYDAILTECGDLTEKYYEFKKVISEFTEIKEVELLPQTHKIAYGRVAVLDKVSLFNTLETLSSPVKHNYPLSMEELNQNYGYILYRSDLGDARRVEKMYLLEANDRAQIFVNNNHIATQYDQEIGQHLSVDLEQEKSNRIDILIENMGRANFGPKLNAQRKGLKGGLVIDNHGHYNWEHYNLELDDINKVDFSREYEDHLPAFYKFELEIECMGDTFIDMTGFGKGVVFINNVNIGRYWEVGPQTKLYVPESLLKKGKNTIIVFETEGKSKNEIYFSDRPGLDKQK
ncbi:glycoside hydrolase family 35 protein [Haloplasma contractile]|uniref:Beta-galactosidase protein n=1 Tax=Haloplasma contractile SSD-17B TaxID=1033810 RepID=U2DXW2_9MOLU|nr:beta-galactosidase [Haloplasma contractile]ERJ13102.1 beta-galactosidase protein [Haloplasma contractile SSD-17B]